MAARDDDPRAPGGAGGAGGGGFRLDPVIERRLSSPSISFSDAPGTPTLAPAQTQPHNNRNGTPPSRGVPNFATSADASAAQALASSLMYSNIPGLTDSAAVPIPVLTAAERQASFSSLSLPGGHVGSQPHSRRQTPADGRWMDTLDFTRLFAGLGRDKLDPFDETLDSRPTPDKKRRGSASKRGTPARGRPSPESRRGVSAAAVAAVDDDDDDDDSDASFRETIEGPGDHKRHKGLAHGAAFDAHVRSRSGNWVSRLWNRYFDRRNYYNKEFKSRNYESDYLALIPLSDPRLHQRWPLWVFVLLSSIVSLTVFSGVFFFIQRAVAVNQGEIQAKTSSIHVNPSAPGDWHGSYTLDLEIDIPVHNQNYFPATVSGGIGIYLFDYKGGEVILNDEVVDSRSTKVFTLTANASDFDSAGSATIIWRCTISQPHELQFVLKGEFTTKVLFYSLQKTVINTYAIVSCQIKDLFDGFKRTLYL